MMTLDDKSNDGKTFPSLFPAKPEIIEFCEHLREYRSIEVIRNLPEKTGSNYTVELHNGSTFITNKNRSQYFTGLSSNTKQLLLLDPDNGFESEKSYSEKHVLYSDIASLLRQISDDSVISVFHHFRRKSFVEDFDIIKHRLDSGYATAIYWHSLMFVAIGKSRKIIAQVSEANEKYSRSHPVKVISANFGQIAGI
jgi:hypothetical protein